jgi:hypothetical protein
VLAVLDLHGRPPITDDVCWTTCPTCARRQTLAEAVVSREEKTTVYVCASGCQKILVIGSPESTSWPGRGYRLGKHVLRNSADLFVEVGASGIKLPASPASLVQFPSPDAVSLGEERHDGDGERD